MTDLPARLRLLDRGFILPLEEVWEVTAAVRRVLKENEALQAALHLPRPDAGTVIHAVSGSCLDEDGMVLIRHAHACEQEATRLRDENEALRQENEALRARAAEPEDGPPP